MEHCPKSNVKPDIKSNVKFDVKSDAKSDAKSYASSPAMLGPKVRGRESEIDSHIRVASSDEVDSNISSRECTDVGRWNSSSMGTAAAKCMRAHVHILGASTFYSVLATIALSLLLAEDVLGTGCYLYPNCLLALSPTRASSSRHISTVCYWASTFVLHR